MSNDMDVEGLFKDILIALNKRSIPVNTIALDLSLLPQEFETLFSENELSRYKAGIFYKSLQLDNIIPATLRIKRRFPFEEIAFRLERDVLPILQSWGKELEHDFENVQVKVNAIRSDNQHHSPQKYFYSISIECRGQEVVRPFYGGEILSISLSQFDAASYPTITAYVGRLVDEEGDGDWGIKPIATLFPNEQEVHEGILQMLEQSLSRLYQALRTALTKPSSKETT
jgi:hypothetical protein